MSTEHEHGVHSKILVPLQKQLTGNSQRRMASTYGDCGLAHIHPPGWGLNESLKTNEPAVIIASVCSRITTKTHISHSSTRPHCRCFNSRHCGQFAICQSYDRYVITHGAGARYHGSKQTAASMRSQYLRALAGHGEPCKCSVNTQNKTFAFTIINQSQILPKASSSRMHPHCSVFSVQCT